MQTQNFIKPFNDKCKYHTFQLENKLNVLLVEDPETDQSCGTMLVKIGHDHDTVLGIAHFLEHMLFNGTTKYPNEGEYSKFIAKNGGEQNAYTDHDHTCYFFSVQPDALEQALDMFGQFFISPVLDPNSVNREKNAVNSEHVKNITSDAWRLQDVMRRAVTQSNPLKNFGTGSSKTLDIPEIHSYVKEFFEKFYSSHLMTLFVVTKNNMEKVKQSIINIYSQVPYRLTPENMQYFGNKIYDYPKTIKVVPLKEMENLVISWDLPSYKHSQLRSPYRFLSHIIGHEGKNTIHYVLSQLGYITNLYAGIEIHCNDRCTFSINITMTPKGSENKNDILYAIFEYIELMKRKINSEHMENLYNELMTVDAFEFKYSIKDSPMERTMQYAKLVNNYDFDMKDILIIPYAKENFVPNVKKNLLDVLNEMELQKSVIMFVSNSYEGTTNLIDENYGTNYSIENNYPNISNKTINVQMLDLPNLNRFISTNETLITSKYSIPKKINSPITALNLYCLETNTFETPDVNVKVSINLPLSISSAELYVLTTLYFTSLLAEINHEKYMCEVANYRLNTIFVDGKLQVDIFGNSGKIEEVCKFITESLLNPTLITEKIYNTSVYGLTMSSKNAIMTPPFRRVGMFFEKAVCSKYYNNYDVLNVLDSGRINLNMVKNVINSLLDSSTVTILTAGNCTEEMTKNIGHIFTKFIVDDCNIQNNDLLDIYSSPSEPTIITNNVENSLEKNSAVLYNVFIEKTKFNDNSNNWRKNICLLNVLDALISNEFFDEVRTKDGFGYVVNSSKRIYGSSTIKSKYYGFLVQSPNKSVEEIILRIQKFISEYKFKLEKTTDEEFNEVIDAMISQLKAPYNNLTEMTSFIFEKEIMAEHITFDLKDKLIKEYETINLNDLIVFYEEKILKNDRFVIINLVGNRSH